MTIRFYTLLLAIFTLSPLIIPASAQAGIKCWTNNEGIKECGTTVPPEFAQQGHQELSKQGMIKREVDRAKTDQELKEAEKQAQIARDKEDARKRDQILLDTFIKVEDIELAKDDKIAAMESNIKLTIKRNEKMKKALDKHIATVAADKQADRQPSEGLLQDIESLERQIQTNEEHITSKRLEKEQIGQEYKEKVARFKELKGID